MAFNPFARFRKNQKFWMALLILMSMGTFVLCTGVQGSDFGEWLLARFGRNRGPAVGSLDGRTIYFQDATTLKTNRNLANEFMRKGTEVGARKLKEQAAELEKSVKERIEKGAKFDAKETKTLIEQGDLLDRAISTLDGMLSRPRYFSGGTKLDELVDFMMWRDQADRLGINFTEDDVFRLMNQDLLRHLKTLSDQEVLGILYEMRRSYPGITESTLLQGLRDEYRVRAARLALMLGHSERFRLPSAEVRMPLSPAQLWDAFREKRVEYEVSLVPVPVSAFLGQVPAPDKRELEDLFRTHKNKKFDPTSDEPGFQVPHEVKAAWLAGDPESPVYRNLAKAVTLLEMHPLGGDASTQPLLTALRYASSPLFFDASMQRNYENIRSRPGPESHAGAPWSSAVLPVTLARLARPTPETVAALVGAGAAPEAFVAGVPTYRGQAYRRYGREAEKAAAEHAPAPARLFATMVSLGACLPATPLAFGELGPHFILQAFDEISESRGAGSASRDIGALVNSELLRIDVKQGFFPLSVVRGEIEDQLRRNLAIAAVQNAMQIVKQRLEDPQLAGKGDALKRLVDDLEKEFSLSRGSTKESYNRYTIDQAKELEPLRTAFENIVTAINQLEAREMPETRLTPADFHKLFFDSSESFAATSKHVPRPWPPVISVPTGPIRGPSGARQSLTNLWDDAVKPFYFWKTDDQPGSVPATLDQAKERVEKAWQTQQARDKLALPKAKKIAEALQNTGGEYGSTLRAEAGTLGQEVITLKKVSKLVQSFRKGPRRALIAYGDYTLPPGQFEYPRDDMAQQIVALTDLQKPIETKNKELDALNKELFEITKKLPAHEGAGKFVQVLTNKPRTIFYVAVVSGASPTTRLEFNEAYKSATGFTADLFISNAQELAGKEFRDSLESQLRREMRWNVEADQRKSFDTEG